MAKKRQLNKEFSLGGEQAESDPLLPDAFYEWAQFAAIDSRLDPKCFLVSRTGGGKSAALRELEARHPGQVIRIVPEDLSLPYLTDLPVLRFLHSLDVHLDTYFKALWKHVLLVEVIRHRYRVNSPEAKANFLAGLRQKIDRDPAKKQALDYLNDFQDRFWVESDVRVKEITERFDKQVRAAAYGELAIPGLAKGGAGGEGGVSVSKEVRSQEVARFQKIVNDTQLPRLNKMIRVLDDDILDSAQNYVYVVIDDLDRDWADTRFVSDLIRCLFSAVLDFQSVKNLKILVALRTNIFEQLQFHRSGGQEEKYRSLILKMQWSKQELSAMLEKRASVASSLFRITPPVDMEGILPRSSKANGNPIDFVLSRTLMRPRDAVSYMNECLARVADSIPLSWADIRGAERPYSVNRLLALRDEWKASLPGVEAVFAKFKGAPSPMSRAEFEEYLISVILLLSERDFGGQHWLTPLSEGAWMGSADLNDWGDMYQPLTRFLFDLGFIGYSKPGTRAPLYAYDEPGFADRPSNLEPDGKFHVHPAFQAALDISEGRRAPPG